MLRSIITNDLNFYCKLWRVSPDKSKKNSGIVYYVILVCNCGNWFVRKQLSWKKIVNGRIDIIDIFVFDCSFARSLSQLWFLNCCSISVKTRKISSSFESTKWQKSVGSVTNPIDVSTATLPFSISNNCFENIIAVLILLQKLSHVSC